MKIQSDLKRELQKVGEKELNEYFKKSIKNINTLLSTRNKVIEDYKKFQLQLMGISGGTITIFLALQSGNAPFLIKLGFGLLGLSLLFGAFSLFLAFESKHYQEMLYEETLVSSDKNMLDWFENVYQLNIDTHKFFQEQHEALVKDYKTKIQKRQNRTNNLLGLLHLDGQGIDDLQIATFTLGVLSLALGLFF